MTTAVAKIRGVNVNDPARWNAGVTATTGGKPVSQTQDIQFGDERLPDRFWAKVLVNPETECWEWQASLRGGGYAAFYVEGKIMYGHRIAYETLAGNIPTGLTMDHLCRVRECVNPVHLEPVTVRENNRRGLGTKLTREQVGEIKARLSMGETPKSLAPEFGVVHDAIHAIKTGFHWPDIEPANLAPALGSGEGKDGVSHG